MPCDYSEYHPKWKLIRRLVLKRALHSCEECGIKNYAIIKRVPDSDSYRIATKEELSEVEVRKEFEAFNKILKSMGLTRVVLTISHQDHDKGNNRFWNLKALCQRHHLIHDKHIHISKRKETLANMKLDREKQQIKLQLECKS